MSDERNAALLEVVTRLRDARRVALDADPEVARLVNDALNRAQGLIQPDDVQIGAEPDEAEREAASREAAATEVADDPSAAPSEAPAVAVEGAEAVEPPSTM